VVGVNETTIQLYRWNQAATLWDLIPSTLSLDRNVVSATITNLGFLALFADSTADATPPAQINNLVATIGTNEWSVLLAWTDVGDDGQIGQATTYILKYSTSEITAANWDAATRHILGIAPQTSGTPESCVVKMPDPGVLYYFAVKAVDEAGNLGPLSNVTNARSHQYDSDADLMPDQWESTYQLDPTNGVDAAGDEDGDGLTNLEEFQRGTNPKAWDSDGDGMGDLWEIVNAMNPLSSEDGTQDADGDGLSNREEYKRNTDLFNPDSDGDGSSDGNEIAAGTDPNSATDVFKIVTAEGTTNYILAVTWNAKSGMTYRVDMTSDLQGTWTNASNGVGSEEQNERTAISNGTLRYLATTPVPVTNRFYRVNKLP
jgi:hypothetical protein